MLRGQGKQGGARAGMSVFKQITNSFPLWPFFSFPYSFSARIYVAACQMFLKADSSIHLDPSQCTNVLLSLACDFEFRLEYAFAVIMVKAFFSPSGQGEGHTEVELVWREIGVVCTSNECFFSSSFRKASE